MKQKLFLLFFISSLYFTSSAQIFPAADKHSFDDLIGSWRNRQGTGLDIVDSNTIYVVRGGERKRAAVQITDLTKTPMNLNLSVKDSARTITLKSVLLFVSDNMLQWQVFDSETKPASYRSDKGDMLFLRRIEQLSN